MRWPWPIHMWWWWLRWGSRSTDWAWADVRVHPPSPLSEHGNQSRQICIHHFGFGKIRGQFCLSARSVCRGIPKQCLSDKRSYNWIRCSFFDTYVVISDRHCMTTSITVAKVVPDPVFPLQNGLAPVFQFSKKDGGCQIPAHDAYSLVIKIHDMHKVERSEPTPKENSTVDPSYKNLMCSWLFKALT